MNYFKDCKNQGDVKRLYREWAMKLHPDKGGKKEDMIELQRQYEEMLKYGPSDDPVNQYWNEEMKRYSQGFGYSGHGGYQYNNQSNMWNEYNQQKNNPRISGYERLKSAFHDLENDNYHLKCRLCEAKLENEKLKKKLENLKNKLKNMKKPTKKSSKQSVIHL